MRRILGALALILLCATPAVGQGARSDGTIFAPTGMPVAGASVQVCTQPASGSPCSPLASIFTNVGLTVPASNPLTTDQFGNYFFYVTPGIYTVEIFGMGLVDKQLPDQTVTLPLTLTPTFTTVTVTGSIILDGSTSGTITLVAPAVAGSNTATFPAATGNVVLDSSSQTLSGKTFAQNLIPDTTGRTVGTNALPYSTVFLGGAATNNIGLTGTATAARTATLPDNTGTIAELNLAQTYTATQTFPSASLPPGVLSAGTNGQCVITSGGVSVWGACSGTSGANTALSNLSSVAINTTLLPATAGGENLGTAALPFGDVFIGGSASHALDFNVAALTANRTITLPDNSGTVAELNANQTFTGTNQWNATPTFTVPIVSTVSTGTAPLTIASTTVVPNLNVNILNGVTITGSPSAGQILLASGPTAAAWGTSVPISIQNFCSNTISAPVSVTLNTATAVNSVNCTMPAAGGPWRAHVDHWNIQSGGVWDRCYVSDGTRTWAQGGSTTVSGLGNCAGAGWSPTTYANSAAVTFTIFENNTGNTTVEPSDSVTGVTTTEQVSIQSSN